MSGHGLQSMFSFCADDFRLKVSPLAYFIVNSLLKNYKGSVIRSPIEGYRSRIDAVSWFQGVRFGWGQILQGR